ncbi:glycosyltransferase family 2 protein [Desertihabitans brevis]|uniref:Glycosyltransferase family 2 protein n=1 Tax=Desertihabitans brevis TaxID=2268447 RepID=A0A367YTQ3_9ACTN|nr:glycosyltransferase [Desertihabitans brevis]RCK69137.1 glycosyltransferase family 2 protein [Desertihabitans brevis]
MSGARDALLLRRLARRAAAVPQLQGLLTSGAGATGRQTLLGHTGLHPDEVRALERELPLAIRLRHWRPGGRTRVDVLLHLADGPSGTDALLDLAGRRVPVVSADADVRAVLGQAPAGDRTSLLAEARALAAQPLLRDRRAHQQWRALRQAQGAGTGGSQEAGATPSVSAVVPTMRPHQLEHVLATIGAQRHPSVELVLVTHGFTPDEGDLRRWRAERGVEHLVVRHADASLTLGACLRLGVAAAAGDLVAKMDDDNHYGPHYLSDLVAHARQTGAETVGKGAHYVHLTGPRATMLRFADRELAWSPFVQGGTLLTPREVLADVPFADVPRAVDTTFLEALRRQGGRVWSADRFSFVSIRHTAADTHTWPISDYDLLSRAARLELFGDPVPHVTV